MFTVALDPYVLHGMRHNVDCVSVTFEILTAVGYPPEKKNPIPERARQATTRPPKSKNIGPPERPRRILERSHRFSESKYQILSPTPIVSFGLWSQLFPLDDDSFPSPRVSVRPQVCQSLWWPSLLTRKRRNISKLPMRARSCLQYGRFAFSCRIFRPYLHLVISIWLEVHHRARRQRSLKTDTPFLFSNLPDTHDVGQSRVPLCVEGFAFL